VIVNLLSAVVSAVKNAFLSGGDGGTVLAIDSSGGPYDTTVGIRFHTDGTVETGTSTGGAALSWTSAGTYINPPDIADGNQSVRYTNLLSSGGHDFTTQAAAEDAWVDNSVTRTWTWNETNTLGPPNNSFSCDFECRDDVGNLPTGNSPYTFTIENTA